MANREKVTFMYQNPPLEEHGQERDDVDDFEEAAWGNGCCCFPLFRSKDDGNHLLHHNGEHREAWWSRKLKEVKEYTELVGGPKWKGFIRKISGQFNKIKNKNQRNRFQYDAQSYALNFDDGADGEADGLLHDLSARFDGRRLPS